MAMSRPAAHFRLQPAHLSMLQALEDQVEGARGAARTLRCRRGLSLNLAMPLSVSSQ